MSGIPVYPPDRNPHNKAKLQEIIIQIEAVNPVEIFGINNANLTLLKNRFPKLKILARGSEIRVMGDASELKHFEGKINQLIEHYNKYNQLNGSDIELILDGTEHQKDSETLDAVLVYGPKGKLIKARTANQRKMVNMVDQGDLVFAIGPAGTGKTYTAVALAVRALKNKEVKRIMLTRPAVEAGEHLGFLPGDLKEKLDPYLQPLYDALHDMLPDEKLESYIEKRIIQIAPLAFMRGRTLDNAFVILDEAQNATESQLKMFLTRMGKSAKFVITGDVSQIDLPRNQRSGLVHAIKVLKGLQGIYFLFLDETDVIRHKLVKKIIKAYKSFEDEPEDKKKA